MVPQGTLCNHRVPRPGWGGTLLGNEDILGFLTFEKNRLKNCEKSKKITEKSKEMVTKSEKFSKKS